MAISLRSLARTLLGVRRAPTYYLPWITRPGLRCTLLISNVESRFKAGYKDGPFPVSVVQYDSQGGILHRYRLELANSSDAIELTLDAPSKGYGFVTISGDRLHSDLYVTLSDGEIHTATHGRGEFVETYPLRARALLRALAGLLTPASRTLPVFARDQYVYVGPANHSHILLMNLSNVTNRIRMTASLDGSLRATRLLTIPPMGAELVDVAGLSEGPPRGTVVWRVRFEGNAWFNLYLVGAGPAGLAGLLSLMHVK